MDPTWIAKAQTAIAGSEYHFVRQADGCLSAPNRAHGLRTLVRPEGIEILPAAETADGFRVTLTLRSWGREGGLLPVGAGTVELDGGRAEIRRRFVTERVVNERTGIEHGLTLFAAPPGTRGPAILTFALGEGVLVNPMGTDGKGLRFDTPEGKPAVYYTQLAVHDASGRELPARLEPAPGEIRIVIDDAGARYPLDIDPLATSAQWAIDSNQATALFGYSVATAGDVNGDGYSDVIVGAYAYDNGQADEGRAYIYPGGPSGLSTTPARILEQNQAGAEFGFSVSSLGDFNNDGFDDIAIGAPHWQGTIASEGAVFIYLGSATGIGTTADKIYTSGQGSSNFGAAVAGAGDVNGDGFSDMILGAYNWSGTVATEGKAFVFEGGASFPAAAAWSVEPTNQAVSLFGQSVAGAGDVNADGFDDVIIGGPGVTLGQSVEGSAYVYLGSASGLATSIAWQVQSNQANAELGWSVGTAGDVNGDGYADVIVGAPREGNGQGTEGIVRIYHGSSTGPSTTAARTLESNQGGAMLGWSVATAGDVNGDGYADVIVGARLWDNVQIDEGAAFVYLGGSGGIAATSAWSVESNEASAEMGRSVATAGDVNGDGFSDVIVGSPLEDNPTVDEGVARAYLGSGDTISATANDISESNDPHALLGWVVSPAGDVNGDGYTDILAATLFYGPPVESAERVYVWHGGPNGIPSTPTTTLTESTIQQRYGLAASSAGDVNGDGYDDVIVGAQEWPGNVNFRGKFFVYAGSASGLSTLASWSAEGLTDHESFGRSVTSGDFNGDGFSDVAVGGGGLGALGGYVKIYNGSALGLPADASTTIGGTQSDSANFGTFVGTADVNGDGYSDLLLTAANIMALRVYLGSPTGIDPTTFTDRTPTFLGAIVSIASGDVNGDGFSDVVVGTPSYQSTSAQDDEGAAWLYLGSVSGLATTPAWHVESNVFRALMGNAVAMSDVNDDGLSDVLVAASHNAVGAGPGQVFVYHGSASGPSTVPARTLTGASNDDVFGLALAGSEDVNGDGFGDMTVGVPGWTNPETTEGRVEVYYGNLGDGLDRKPRMFRDDNSGPLALLGGSAAQASFRILALERPPQGRAKVAMDHEAVDLGAPLDGSAIIKGGYFDSGAVGANGSDINFNRRATGLTGGPFFKWRFRFRTRSPLFPHSPWLTLPGNALNERDLRTNCIITTWYLDADADTYGTNASTLVECIQPAGFVGRGGDCNDGDATMFPGHAEICDGKDNNCNTLVDDGFVAPALPPSVNGGTKLAAQQIEFTWPPVAGADRYDAIRGSLATLKSSNGNFTTSTNACLVNDTSLTSADDTEVLAAGNGSWFLIGAVNCNARGTYDDLAPSQVGSRDAEIAASPSACP